MDRQKSLYRFHFNNHSVRNQQVQLVTSIKQYTVVENWRRELKIHFIPALYQLMNQANPISTLQQPWPQHCMDLHSRVNNGAANKVVSRSLMHLTSSEKLWSRLTCYQEVDLF